MSSGQFDTIPLASITIARAERIRKELDRTAVESLSESISRIGLLHPPVVTRERILVAGENRIEACRLLGWTSISVQYSDTLDSRELLAIELEENVKRSDLPWQDQCDALRRFHELQQEIHDDWTVDQTAAAVGLAPRTVYDQLNVARALVDGDASVVSAPKYSVAKNLVARKTERAAADELNSLIGDVSTESPAPLTSPILCADFNEWANSYSGRPFNLLHCDFPYGIDAQDFHQTANAALGDYDDSFAVYESLLDTLEANRDKLLGESAHVIFWFSMRHYTYTLQRLSAMFRVDPFPLIWHKSDNKGTLPDPSRGPRRVYEVAFFASHGDRKIISPVSNTFSGPTIRTVGHMSEKSTDMLAHFMRMCVDANTRLLDPTCGSGSAVRAADSLGAAHVLGLERSPEFAEDAARAWRDSR